MENVTNETKPERCLLSNTQSNTVVSIDSPGESKTIHPKICPLKKNKLSGAQRRKLKKAKMIAEGRIPIFKGIKNKFNTYTHISNPRQTQTSNIVENSNAFTKSSRYFEQPRKTDQMDISGKNKSEILNSHSSATPFQSEESKNHSKETHHHVDNRAEIKDTAEEDKSNKLNAELNEIPYNITERDESKSMNPDSKETPSHEDNTGTEIIDTAERGESKSMNPHPKETPSHGDNTGTERIDTAERDELKSTNPYSKETLSHGHNTGTERTHSAEKDESKSMNPHSKEKPSPGDNTGTERIDTAEGEESKNMSPHLKETPHRVDNARGERKDTTEENKSEKMNPEIKEIASNITNPTEDTINTPEKDKSEPSNLCSEENPHQMENLKEKSCNTLTESTENRNKDVEIQRRGVKRRHPKCSTQNHPAKKPKSFPPKAEPSRETLNVIRMAIIDKRHPEVTLSQEQSDQVQEKLVDAINSSPPGSGSQMQFLKSTFSGGVLWMSCANEGTANWLKNSVKNMAKPWEGADLTAVESKDLPRRPRVLVFIPGPIDPLEKVRVFLEKQNTDLRVRGWYLISRKQEENGQILAFSIDEISYKALQTSRLKAFYKFGRVTFRVLKELVTLNNEQVPPTGEVS